MNEPSDRPRVVARTDDPAGGDTAARLDVMASMLITLDGLWFRNVLAALGPEATLAMDIRVFRGQFRIATRLIRERFGTDGKSRRDKAVVLEQMARLYGHDFEIVDEPGAVTMRLHRCAFLDALRAAGRTDHDCRAVCRALRPAWFEEIEPRTGGAGEVRLGLPDGTGTCDWSVIHPAAEPPG
jgi:hypothetical protein